jgi:PAS domain S-box-containing protein
VNEQAPNFLAYLPPTARQTRLALGAAAVLLLGFTVLAPFASQPLPKFTAFTPALDATIFITGLITASLFLAQFLVRHSRALLGLACGYFFSALIVVAHGLSFAGAFSPAGTNGAIIQSTIVLYSFWHLAIPVASLAYVTLNKKDRAKGGSPVPTAGLAVSCMVGMLALAVCLTWLAVGSGDLPALFGRFEIRVWFGALTILVCAVALLALWVSRRAALDQWLMVVVLATLVETVTTALIPGLAHPMGPTLGFYSGRIFSLLASILILTVLLAETATLYARLAHAGMLTGALRASQSLSGEIELPSLIEKLMTVALQHAGADRGLLILGCENDYRIEAEARAGGAGVVLLPQHDPAIPETIIRYVFRRHVPVILNDVAIPNLFSGDPYCRTRRPKSVLCLPLIRQGVSQGVLYLENTLLPHGFTPERARLLELLASQAAISLEKAALYTDLQLQVGVLQNLPVSAWTLRPDGTPDFVNQVWLKFSGQVLDFVRSHPEAWMSAVHPDDRELAASSFWEGVRSGKGFAMETRSLRAQDGTYRWHLNQAVALRDSEGKVLKFVGTTTDIDDQKRVEEALRQAQDYLARINRVTTMGELAASLAHELNQPISGALINANVCLRMLGGDGPDIDGARATVVRFARDTQRAADIIGRVSSQFKRRSVSRELVDLNEIHQETIALLRDEAVRHNVSVRTELAGDLPPTVGDRVQLQQVAMNLIVNGIEAMKDVDRKREMTIKSQRADDQQILVLVSDTGVGFAPEMSEQLFAPFFTTKANGTGMGLRICRSIVESHGGRLWAVGAPGQGATFHFSLPAADDTRLGPEVSAGPPVL